MKLTSPLRLLALCALFLALGLQAACGNACLSLAKQVCACLPDDGTQAACNQRAAADQDNFPVRPEDEAYCQKKLDEGACDCNNLTTPAVKEACGFSYPTVSN